MKISPIFAWFDFWIGFYWDQKKTPQFGATSSHVQDIANIKIHHKPLSETEIKEAYNQYLATDRDGPANTKREKNMNAFELTEAIVDLQVDFAQDAAEFLEQGNKSAGIRARKSTLKLDKLYNEFRRKSVHWGCAK